jgi:hypothetical protein
VGASGIESINENMQVANPFHIESGSGLNLSTSSPYTLTLNGVISGTGGMTVAGAVELTGSNTYSNGTGLNAGSGALLVVSNSNALGTGGLNVNENTTLALSSGIMVSNPIVLNDAGAIVGYGEVAPTSPTTYTVENGSMIAGGSGTRAVFNGTETPVIPGTLSFGSNVSLVFASEGILQFSIENAGGTPGTDFSQITSAGSLTISPSTLSDPFVIQLVGVNSGGSAGTATFNPTQSYQWTLISTTGISGFSSPTQFSVDQQYFQTSVGSGQFYVSQVGSDLDLNFTPVPEPSTWALMASGLCAMGAAVRRRRRS